MVRCTWDRAAIQAAEQTAQPSAVRAGGRVLPQIAVLKSTKIHNSVHFWNSLSGALCAAMLCRSMARSRHRTLALRTDREQRIVSQLVRLMLRNGLEHAA
jgi:hypothetical protein